MNARKLAERLNGCEYDRELNQDERGQALASGLLVVRGRSDDICCLSGVVEDEVYCYDGGTVQVDRHGILQPWGSLIEDGPTEREVAEYLARKEAGVVTIDILWNDEYPLWTYELSGAVEFAMFDIMSDEEPERVYCRGMVVQMPSRLTVGDVLKLGGVTT